MLTDDDLRKFGFESGLLRLKGTTITRWKDGIDIDYPVREVEQFARAVEQAAYERAAQLCERTYGAHLEGEWTADIPCFDTAAECAVAIRSLMEQPK